MSVERISLPVVALCAALCAQPVCALEQAAGIELGFLSIPLLTEDPYSFAASASLYYDIGGLLRRPFTAGAWAGAAGFRPMDGDFGASVMYYGGLEFGYTIPLFGSPSARFGLRPMARLGWYYRGVEARGKTEWGSRPFPSAGAVLTLRSEKIDLGIAAMVSAPLDNRPVILFGLLQRLGLCF